MPKAVITDFTFEDVGIETAILEPLGCRVVSQKTAGDRARLTAFVADADFVITQFAPLDAAVIAGMEKCRVIVRYGIGVDNVDIAAAAARSIPVCNVPDYCIDEVADHALAMILSVTRRVCQGTAVVRSGSWAMAVPVDQLRTLRTMTVGVVGYGRIGREVALRLRPFKCRVLASDPVVPRARMEADGCVPVTLPVLLAQSDLVTLHCPSTESTRQMINARSLAGMKNGALLVNVSRGTLVNTADLVAALSSGRLAAAGLDVVDPEPFPADSPLLRQDNLAITAHVAAVSTESLRALRTRVAEAVAAAMKGGPLPNVVNGVPSRQR